MPPTLMLTGFLMILAVLCVVFVLLLAWAPHIWRHYSAMADLLERISVPCL